RGELSQPLRPDGRGHRRLVQGRDAAKTGLIAKGRRKGALPDDVCTNRNSYRTVTGGGSGGTTVGWVPGTGPDICAGAGPTPAFGPGIGAAEAGGGRRGGGGRRQRRRPAGKHDHAGADLDAVEQVGDVLVQHADATRRDE